MPPLLFAMFSLSINAATRAALLLSLFLLSAQVKHVSARLISIHKNVVNAVPSTRKAVPRIPRGGRTSAASPSAPAATAAATTDRSSTAATEGLKNTLASALAAACSKTILAPFDTIKTVQQHVEGGTSLGLVEAGRIIAARPGGMRNMYAGLGVAVLGSMPSVGLYFGVYSYCKKKIGPGLRACLGSERADGRGALCSDGVLKNVAIVCSAAIGENRFPVLLVCCAFIVSCEHAVHGSWQSKRIHGTLLRFE